MTLTAVLVCHANKAALEFAIEELLSQTRPPDEIVVLASDTPLEELRETYPEVRFVERENEEDWGHGKRAAGIELATGEWIGFFNHDDAYDPTYLERMLSAADGHDVVYCAWNEQPGCDFSIYRSTAGNFVVRAGLAKRVGWMSRRYEADGDFIEALKAEGARVARVDDVLYHHNAR